MTRDSAVSPVIGSILLVAITVIIAAVIAAFVFGMTGDIQATKIVAVVSDARNDTITITYHGGKDAGSLVSLAVLSPDDCDSDNSWTNTPAVGSSAKCDIKADDSLPIHVVVVGTFNDGTEQVLLDTFQRNAHSKGKSSA